MLYIITKDFISIILQYLFLKTESSLRIAKSRWHVFAAKCIERADYPFLVLLPLRAYWTGYTFLALSFFHHFLLIQNSFASFEFHI